MRCAPRRAVDAVHLEIFVNRRVLIMPAGIGLRPPLRRAGIARLAGGRCAYPLHTLDPTGTVLRRALAAAHAGRLLHDLGPAPGCRGNCSRSAGRVRAFRNGREWKGDPRRMPLRRHDEIVLEVGGYVPPHTRYLFPEGR